MSESNPAATAPHSETVAAARSPRTYRILVVDDDADMLLLIGSALRHSTGFASEVFIANDPRTALEKAEKERFDIVVTDYLMPGTNGLELLAEFRRLHPGVLRVLMTAHSSEKLAVNAVRAAEVDTYIEKPFPPSQLVAVLQEVTLRRDPLRVGAGLREESSESATRLVGRLQASLHGVPQDLAELTLTLSFDSPVDLNSFIAQVGSEEEPKGLDVRYVGGRFQVQVALRPEDDFAPTR